MKKILLVICILLLTACTEKTNPKIEYNDEIISFRLHIGSGLGGYNNYELNKENDKYFIVYNDEPYYGDSDDNIKKEVTNNFIGELNKIIKEYDIYSWNGFNGSDPNVMDGSEFSLYIGYSDKKAITASGYMMFPDNYNLFKEKVIKLFKNYN